MAKDKARDDKLFNCSEDHEIKYVSGLYEQEEEVAVFLKEQCKKGVIKNFTHSEVYELIEEELGYSKISKLKIKED